MFQKSLVAEASEGKGLIEYCYCLLYLYNQSFQMVWIETPTNPTLKLVDIKAVVDAVKATACAECFVVVDNTFMSSYFQVSDSNPFQHADTF